MNTYSATIAVIGNHNMKKRTFFYSSDEKLKQTSATVSNLNVLAESPSSTHVRCSLRRNAYDSDKEDSSFVQTAF